jgi:hypothetical protein
MTSPRTKLPNSGTKRPSWRTARIQNRRLGLIIAIDRGWRAAFERGDATGAQGFAGHETDGTFAALAVRRDALALDVLDECTFLWAVDVPEAEIILVDNSHLDRPQLADDVKRHGKAGGASISLGNNSCDAPTNNLRKDIDLLPFPLLHIWAACATRRRSNTRCKLHYDSGGHASGAAGHPAPGAAIWPSRAPESADDLTAFALRLPATP